MIDGVITHAQAAPRARLASAAASTTAARFTLLQHFSTSQYQKLPLRLFQAQGRAVPGGRHGSTAASTTANWLHSSATCIASKPPPEWWTSHTGPGSARGQARHRSSINYSKLAGHRKQAPSSLDKAGGRPAKQARKGSLQSPGLDPSAGPAAARAAYLVSQGTHTHSRASEDP